MNFWDKYGAHVLGYVLSGLTLVSELPPALTAHLPYASLVVGLAGIVLTGIHNLQTFLTHQAFAVIPVTTVAPKSPPTLPPAAAAFAVFLCSLFMGGCTLLSTPSAQQLLVQDAVELGVSTFLDTQPAAQRASDATALILGAQAVEAVSGNNATTLATLEADIATKLSGLKNLSPLQQQLINQAVDTAVGLLAGKLSSGVLSPTQQASINAVMGWIVIGATPYAPST